MKQLWQNISTGESAVVEVPAPCAGKGQIVVRVEASLISAGTERTVVDFAEKNLLQKALARPDLVKQFTQKARRDGWLPAIEAARNRMDSEMVLGYSNSGIVIEVGEGITEFQVGDSVACAGGGFATHSEIVRVPRNLAAAFPKGPGLREVSFDHAAFATVAAVGLQGIRLADLQLGETVAVIGLGLIGQIVVQLARANGCTVVGMDPSTERCVLAKRMGCIATTSSDEEMGIIVARHSGGLGVDAVLITAATDSNAPVALAAEIARDRARIVAVGAVGLDLPRKAYYMKELDFRISRSYGPGRYDVEYEEKGHDYPIGYVRWTEGRNLSAVLQLLATGQLDVAPLITHRFMIEEAHRGYELITSGEPFLGVVIAYPHEPSTARRVEFAPVTKDDPAPKSGVNLGLLGAGSFARATLVPAIRKAGGITLAGICAAGGSSARSVGTRAGFRFCASSASEILDDPSINTIAICTRHDDHAKHVVAALDAGKHVFCEKPLALSAEQLADIIKAYERQSPTRLLMVGYNRRFAPLAKLLKSQVEDAVEPFVMHYRINAGFIPPDHWTQDVEQGGGRIIGEVCHFVDFLSFICGHPVTSVSALLMEDTGRYSSDNLIANLRFANGSIGTITYAANGDRSFSKERIEVFVQGRVAVLDDFRELVTVRDGNQKRRRSHLRIDKGHCGEWQAFSEAIRCGAPSPIPFEDLLNSTLATLALVRGGSERKWVDICSDRLLADLRTDQKTTFASERHS